MRLYGVLCIYYVVLKPSGSTAATTPTGPHAPPTAPLTLLLVTVVVVVGWFCRGCRYCCCCCWCLLLLLPLATLSWLLLLVVIRQGSEQGVAVRELEDGDAYVFLLPPPLSRATVPCERLVCCVQELHAGLVSPAEEHQP